ncbi:hypothetical protein [Schaalia sp. lx-100]|uniref:hypothetical protein n=1 Tax=Schaalia sp. lx-100 TaxID=2899081 RepID=UPI001E4EAE43|nr:hypothetical protein [Schaalia sp. lx-100]MCD4556720.1 hypothetical protein [Schaalia sp. lx-100]
MKQLKRSSAALAAGAALALGVFTLPAFADGEPPAPGPEAAEEVQPPAPEDFDSGSSMNDQDGYGRASDAEATHSSAEEEFSSGPSVNDQDGYGADSDAAYRAEHDIEANWDSGPSMNDQDGYGLNSDAAYRESLMSTEDEATESDEAQSEPMQAPEQEGKGGKLAETGVAAGVLGGAAAILALGGAMVVARRSYIR